MFRASSGQEINCSIKVIGVDIHKKLVSAPVKKEQKLNVSMVNYVSSKSKAKPG